MIAFRAPSSARDKGTLMPAAISDARNLLISNKKRNRQETTKEIEEKLENSKEEIVEIRLLIKAFYLTNVT